MERQYKTIPVSELAHDVAVDRQHVERLAASIKAQGQLAPVQVRDDGDIIDGFHRVDAIGMADLNEVECVEVACTNEEFLDLRIASALTHEGVKADRAVPWIIAEVAKAWPGQEAYTLFDGSKKGTAAHAVRTWVNLKSETWGVSTGTIASWLYAHRRLAPDVWADKKLDYGQRREIARATTEPDLQRQLASKVVEEGLFYRQTATVAQAAATTEDEEERQHILETPLEQQDVPDLKRRAKVARFLKTPPTQKREDKRQDEARRRLLFFAMAVPDLLKQLRSITYTEVEVLDSDQKANLHEWLVDLKHEVTRVEGYLGFAIEGEMIEEVTSG